MADFIILTDVDGCLSDFVGAYLKLIKKVTGKYFTRDQVTEYEMDECLGLSEEEKKELHYVVAKSNFCSDMDLLPGAKEGFKELLTLGKVFVVTSPWHSPTWAYQRSQWLINHFAFKNVISTKFKHMVRGNVIIDDKTSILEEWLAENGGDTIRMETSYNKNEPWQGPSRYSFDNWGDILATVKMLKAEHEYYTSPAERKRSELW